MHASNVKYIKLRWELVVVMVAMLLASISVQRTEVEAAPTKQVVGSASGLVCKTSPNATFTLTAKKGYISTPDGNTIFMWSYAPDTGDFQLPGPPLCVTQNETVTIILKNTLPEDVSIIFPGQEDVKANGVAAQPVFSGPTLTSLTNVATAADANGNNGGSVTYSFVAKEPGTYLYESGTDISKQVEMGLFGALIVRPAGNAGQAYSQTTTKFNTNKEYLMLLSEIDPDLHYAVEHNQKFDITSIHPRYWMINGRSFPDTISDNFAQLLPSQPYSALIHISPYDATLNPDPALVRYINVGMRDHPFHPHGNHGRVIARDGRALAGPLNEDLSYEKFSILIGTSQTWDVTYKWTDVEHWNPTTNPIPVPLPSQQNLTYKDAATWYSGSPYLGVQDDLPSGTTSYNQCGEYYQVWHSHALNEAANYDTGFGGMFTLQRIDPPAPNRC